jgi:hypothetical protein
MAAFKSEGFELTSEGGLGPLLLTGLSGSELTEALFAYVRRAQRGATDAALVPELARTSSKLLQSTF